MKYDVLINVASDFSRFPSGRTATDSAFSGQEFREKFLARPLHEGKQVLVQLDGAIGYGSSFLEEAFGGLIREHKFKSKELLKILHFESFDDSLINEIVSYIEEA